MEHELNTALTVLRLRVQLLQRKSLPDQRHSRRLGEILESVDEVQRVSAKLLSEMRENGAEGSAPERAGDQGIARPVERPHVAVVNDDTTFLRLMDELLRVEEGYEVSTSFVGSEAYLFVRGLQPDLVVLDLVFGDNAEQGWRTLDLLTLDPATRRIPVVVCSATTVQLQDHADWLRRFDVEVLPKPFDLDTLLEMIRSTLGEPRTGTARDRG
jgi:CheY-like chemotaxis protein